MSSLRHDSLVTLKGGAVVSRLGLGTAQLGGLYTSLPVDDGAELVQFSLNNGVRYLDTAPHYGKGTSERRLGSYLQGIERTSFTISTKVGRLLVPSSGSVDADFADADNSVERLHDYSASGVLRSVEESLERLQLERIDIAYIHDPDDFADQAIHEAYAALESLRSQGLIKSIGVGMNYNEIPTRFVNETDIDLVMIAGRYTLLDQSADRDLFPSALRKGVDIVAVGVFNSGILANPSPTSHFFYGVAPEAIVKQAKRLQAIATDFGFTLSQAALQFPLRHPAVKSVVVGCRSAKSLARNISEFNNQVSEEAWSALQHQIDSFNESGE